MLSRYWYLLSNTQFWIGFSDQNTEGQFTWSDGSTSTYAKWAPTEPSNSGPTGNEDYTLINTTEEGVYLWILDLSKSEVRKVSELKLNANIGSVINW